VNISDSARGTGLPQYVPPTLVVLGSVHGLTLTGCWRDKQFGGSDGFVFMGINVPISNCS
jgi:hypothetical protein